MVYEIMPTSLGSINPKQPVIYSTLNGSYIIYSLYTVYTPSYI